MSEIRIGQVSSINYKSGMIKVLYNDYNNSVTKDIPYLSFNDEYKMPAIGQYVLVVHLSNGNEAGIVLGTYWNEANKPIEAKQGIYRKEFGHHPGQAYLTFDYKSGELVLYADKIVFQDINEKISLKEIINKIKG